jgi:hypothetical protein
VGGVRFEYAHRVLAGLVSVLTLILAIWVTRVDRRPLARKLSWTALALVLAQAVLGGIRVLVGHPALSATAHATLAQIYFLTIVGLSVYLSPWWQSDLPQLDDTSSPSARSLTLWTTLAILAQLVLGAAFRHGAFGINPHLMGAGILIVLVVWTGRTVKKRFKAGPRTAPWRGLPARLFRNATVARRRSVLGGDERAAIIFSRPCSTLS